MLNRIYCQICADCFYDYIEAHRDGIVEEAVRNSTAQWDEIIVDLIELFPLAADKIEFGDLIDMFMELIPMCDKEKSDEEIINYIEGFAFAVANAIIGYLSDLNYSMEKITMSKEEKWNYKSLGKVD